MRIWVTGGRGFVGQRLVRQLAARGHAVVSTDSEVDVTDLAAVSAAVVDSRPEAVAHLAALTFIPASVADPETAFQVNTLGTRQVLEAVARHAPEARVLLVSSGLVYGGNAPGDPPFRESSPLAPASPYAWTKAAADRFGAVYAGRGLAVVRARPFNHSGPGRPASFAESHFARQVAEIECGRRSGPLRVGNLDAVRDFLDVDDVVDAYVALLDPAVPAGLYNVASGRGWRMGDLLEVLLKASRVRPVIEVDAALVRPADASVGCAERLQAATGWQPRRPFELTLTRLLDYWRQQLDAPGSAA